MKTIILNLAFLMVTVNGHPHPQASGNVEEVKISWEDASKAVERVDTDVVTTFLANHQIDEEGTFIDDDGYKNQGVTLLEVAAYHGNVDAVQQLLKAQPGPNINHQDEIGWSPLHWALREGHLEVTRMLLDAENIDINLQDNYGKSPLHWAARGGLLEVTRMLLDADKININLQDNNGRSALYLAADRGHLEVTRMLMDADDIDINLQNDWGYNALMLAAENGEKDVVELIIKQSDINLDLQVTHGWLTGFTALDLAKKEGHSDVAELLESKNAACNKTC